MHILGGLRLGGGGGSRALWRLGRGTLLGGPDLEDVPLDCGNLLFQLFPLSFLSYLCVCVCVSAPVCVYIYIIIYICLLVCWKIVEVGRGLAPEPDFPRVFNCPTAELCCRQTILWRKGEEGNQPSRCAK